MTRKPGLSRSTKILVVMGGVSSERSISLQTGRAVLRALRELGYAAEPFDLTRASLKTLCAARPGFVFIALHGAWGEDGRIQALLDMRGIPYSGSGMRASALCLDKIAAKELLAARGLPTPRWQAVHRPGDVQQVSLPVVVKPAAEGSAIGVRIVRRRAGIARAIAAALAYGRQALVEEYIAGMEVTVGIIGGRALPVIEILSKRAFYDYVAKYRPHMSEHIIPARLPARTRRAVSALALRAYAALGCRAYARVDMIVTARLRPYILEINTIPGMTTTSLLPDAARAAGMGFNELVQIIIDHSVDRGTA